MAGDDNKKIIGAVVMGLAAGAAAAYTWFSRNQQQTTATNLEHIRIALLENLKNPATNVDDLGDSINQLPQEFVRVTLRNSGVDLEQLESSRADNQITAKDLSERKMSVLQFATRCVHYVRDFPTDCLEINIRLDQFFGNLFLQSCKSQGLNDFNHYQQVINVVKFYNIVNDLKLKLQQLASNSETQLDLTDLTRAWPLVTDQCKQKAIQKVIIYIRQEFGLRMAIEPGVNDLNILMRSITQTEEFVRGSHRFAAECVGYINSFPEEGQSLAIPETNFTTSPIFFTACQRQGVGRYFDNSEAVLLVVKFFNSINYLVEQLSRLSEDPYAEIDSAPVKDLLPRVAPDYQQLATRKVAQKLQEVSRIDVQEIQLESIDQLISTVRQTLGVDPQQIQRMSKCKELSKSCISFVDNFLTQDEQPDELIQSMISIQDGTSSFAIAFMNVWKQSKGEVDYDVSMVSNIIKLYSEANKLFSLLDRLVELQNDISSKFNEVKLLLESVPDEFKRAVSKKLAVKFKDLTGITITEVDNFDVIREQVESYTNDLVELSKCMHQFFRIENEPEFPNEELLQRIAKVPFTSLRDILSLSPMLSCLLKDAVDIDSLKTLFARLSRVHLFCKAMLILGALDNMRDSSELIQRSNFVGFWDKIISGQIVLNEEEKQGFDSFCCNLIHRFYAESIHDNSVGNDDLQSVSSFSQYILFMLSRDELYPTLQEDDYYLSMVRVLLTYKDDRIISRTGIELCDLSQMPDNAYFSTIPTPIRAVYRKSFPKLASLVVVEEQEIDPIRDAGNVLFDEMNKAAADSDSESEKDDAENTRRQPRSRSQSPAAKKDTQKAVKAEMDLMDESDRLNSKLEQLRAKRKNRVG